MDEVAKWPAGDRANLFNEVGARRGLDPGIIEKDFWVCWTLKRLFEVPDTGPALIFKGGTSLSKVFGAIRRFSEDIDLSFDRAALGFEGDRDPAKAPSRKKADRLIEEIDSEVTRYIARRFLPRLNDLFAAALGPGLTGWSVAIGGPKGHDVEFQYPQSLETSDYGRLDYVRAVVRLELGARGDPWPASQREVRSYAAEEFPDQFSAPACTVTALEAERTFWEKATLLHAEAHRPPDKASDRHLSRHYYDLALLADTEHGKKALKRLDLLPGRRSRPGRCARAARGRPA